MFSEESYGNTDSYKSSNEISEREETLAESWSIENLVAFWALLAQNTGILQRRIINHHPTVRERTILRMKIAFDRHSLEFGLSAKLPWFNGMLNSLLFCSIIFTIYSISRQKLTGTSLAYLPKANGRLAWQTDLIVGFH